MTLTNEVQNRIYVLVHGGFDDAERIEEVLLYELHEPGALDAAAVHRFVAHTFEALELSKASWPAVTDCDRLGRAFAQMQRQGLICLQNAGHTQSDGYALVQQALEQLQDAQDMIGYCFFHHQDLERALGGGGLQLAFGPLEPRLGPSLGVEVGQRAVRALAAAGLHAQWDGTVAQRICIPAFDWKYR